MLEYLIDAAAVVAIYVGYIAVTKGVPAATSMVKNWWTAGAKDLATLRGDLVTVQSKVSNLEASHSQVQADVTALKAKVILAGASGAASFGNFGGPAGGGAVPLVGAGSSSVGSGNGGGGGDHDQP